METQVPIYICGIPRLYKSLYDSRRYDDYYTTKLPDAFSRIIPPASGPPFRKEKNYPGAELIPTPPTTSEPMLIVEFMVVNMLAEYKSHFPKDSSADTSAK